MNLTFYYASGANCCDRVRWALDYKRIPYQLADMDGEFDQAHFAAISPFGRVPILEIDGMPLSESMAMLEWLEETFPQRPLGGASALARAKVREMCEAVNASIHPVQNSSVVAYFLPGYSKQQMRPLRARWIGSNLQKLESRLWQTSGFACNEQFTLADIFIALIYRKGVTLGLLPQQYPRYEAHWQFLLGIDDIRASCPLLPATPA